MSRNRNSTLTTGERQLLEQIVDAYEQDISPGQAITSSVAGLATLPVMVVPTLLGTTFAAGYGIANTVATWGGLAYGAVTGPLAPSRLDAKASDSSAEQTSKWISRTLGGAIDGLTTGLLAAPLTLAFGAAEATGRVYDGLTTSEGEAAAQALRNNSSYDSLMRKIRANPALLEGKVTERRPGDFYAALESYYQNGLIKTLNSSLGYAPKIPHKTSAERILSAIHLEDGLNDVSAPKAPDARAHSAQQNVAA